MNTINVNLGSKSYDIVIQKGIVSNIGCEVKKVYINKKIAVITDENVFSLYAEKVKSSLEDAQYNFRFIIVKPGEKSKSMETLKSVYEQLIDFNLTRSDLIVALGGGVVGDLTGFAASTYLRGVDYMQVPTTLLAQVDSSIGGKTAVNIEQGKNLIGSFYQPKMVLIDPDVLETLPDKFIKDGLGEVIKYACIKDSEFFQFLEGINMKDKLFENMEHIISVCLNIKKEIVEKDEFDRGERMLLNFGHTFGHAVEKCTGYKYSHGEAVSVGMYHITEKSEALNITKRGSKERIKNLLLNFNIEYNLSDLSNLNMDMIKNTILLDKKNISGNMNLILLREIGDAFIESVPVKNIEKFF